MNKIYNVVWSHATQSWVVVSELAKAHKKKSSHSSTQSFVDAISQTFKLSLVAALLGSSLSANAATSVNGGQTTGSGTTAVGAGSEAKVEGATAIGENTYANGVAALAIGGGSARQWAAQATADYTVAVGEKSRASGKFATAIGSAASASGKGAVAIGAGYNQGDKDVAARALEDYSIAIGSDSNAAQDGISLGRKATTQGLATIAIGKNASAGTANARNEAGTIVKLAETEAAIAIGMNSEAKVGNAVVVGTGAKALGGYSVVMGTNAIAGNNKFENAGEIVYTAGQVAVGQGALARGFYSTVIGHTAEATNINGFATVIGKRAKVDGIAGTALGVYAYAKGDSSIAIGGPSADGTSVDDNGAGTNARALGKESIAIGKNTEAAEQSVSMGSNAKTQGSGNIAIGKNAGVDASKGTGDANAVQSNKVTDSVAIGTDATATSKNSIVIGNGAKSIRANKSYKTGENAIAIGEGADASYTHSIAMGTKAAVGMTESVAIGNGAKGNVKANGNGKASTAVGARTEAEGDNATAVGVLTYATATNASAFGVSAKAQGVNSVAIGDTAYANAARSISIGRQAQSLGQNSIALGSNDDAGNNHRTVATGNYSMALGANAQATKEDSIALGYKAEATVNGGIAIGKESLANIAGGVPGFDPASGRRNTHQDAQVGKAALSSLAAVSIGNAQQARQINHVAAGSEADDAVNVAQLKAVNLQVKGNTTNQQGADVRLFDQALTVKGTESDFVRTDANNNEIAISTIQAKTTTNANGQAIINRENKGPADGLVTAADIINTINKAGWNIQTSGSNLGTGNQTGKAKVSAGTDVSFQAANNLTAKRTGTTIEYGLASDLTNINSIQGAGNKVSLTAQGVNVGGQNITNLKSGGTTVDNAANIGDVQNISKTNELHIKPNTYAVGTDGSVSLAYENGNNQPVENKTTKITGIARADDLWSLQVDKNGTKTDVNAQNKKVALKQGKNVTLDAAVGQITINADDQVEKVEKDGGDSNTDNLITVTSTNAGKANATYKLNVSKSVVRSAAAWNLKDGKDTGNGHAIAGGESAVFKNADNDNNILVSRNLNAITVGLSKALTGMTSIGGNGSTITFTNAGLDVGSKNITNLASGGDVVTNAANIGDVNRIVGANQWGLQIDNGSRTDVAPVNSKVALKEGNDISLVKTQDGEITINSTAKLHTKGNSAGVGLVSLSDQSLTVKGAENSFIRTSAGNQEITIETKQGSIIPDSAEYSGIPSLGGDDGLVTASTVVDAIQKSGWIAIGAGNVNLNSDGTPGLAYRNLIKPGNTVTFEAGKNLTVVQPSTGDAKFTFALNSKLEGITQVGGNGTTITFNQDGIGLGGDNAPKKITGVANGTDEHDAVNFGQLQNIIAANGSTETVKKDVNVANNLAAVRVSKGSEGAPNAEYSVSVKTEDVKDAARQAVILTQNSTGPIKVTATPNETTHNTNYSVTFDGAEAAKSIPLSYAANNETAKTVTLEQGLKFTNGTRTVAIVENGGVVKFDLNQATADKIDNAITNNTIALGDGTDFTKAQNLTEENGIRFNVVGANNSENIVTKASLGGNNISVDLSSAMKQTINNKANNTLNNITPEGEKVITGLGTEITAGDRISLDGSTTDANGKRHYRISADKQVEAVEAAEHKANDENLVEVTVTSGKKGEANATYAVGVSKQAVQNAAAWILKDGNDTASTGKTISGGQAVVIKNADANVAVKRTDNEISVGLANTLTNINAIGGNSQTIKFENEGINVGGAQITNVKSGGDGPNNAANISDVTRISQANDTFIKKDTYAVNGDNEVVLKYANAAGEVAGEAKITGVAKASDIWSLQANGADVTPNNKKVNLVQGDNISITSKDGTVTISSKFNAADAAKNDLRLVQNQAEGSNGKYAVSETGEVTLTVQDGNGGNKSNVVIGGIAKNDLSNITTTGESKVKNLAAWKIQANDAAEQTVAGGDTVKFKNGQNIEITNENKVFTVKTADNLTASSLTTGNTAVTNSGVTVTNTADPSKSVHLTVSGLNNGGNKITNVERGTESSDAVNKGQLDEIGDNVISLGADGNTATQTQTLRQAGGIKFNVLGGSNITTAGAGNNVTVTLANALTGMTSIAGNGTTVSWTGEGLNLGDGSKQIKGIAKGTQDNDAVNVAQLNAVSTQLNNTVKLGGNTGVTKEQTLSQAGGIQFNVVGAENGKNIVTNATGTDGNVTVDLSDEMKTTINNKANTNLDNITTDGKKVITGLGTVLEAGDRITLDDSKSDKETGKKVYKVSAAEQVEKVVKKAGDDNILEYEAPNAGQANATYTLGVSKAKVADIAKEASAWNLQVNAGNAEKVEGGDTVKFVNGTNIAVTNTGKEITIGTNPNLTATSLETGDTRVETGGITIKNGANGNATVSLTKAGLNNGGNKITNVERGTESSDAVNKGQLDEIGDNVISLGADGNTATQTQTLRQAGGIKFEVKGSKNITTKAEGTSVAIDLSDEAKATLAHKYSVEGVGNNVHVDTDTTDKANTKFKVSVDKTKLEAGVNTTVTGDGITNAFQVNVAGNLSGITSITNNTGSGKVSFAENGVVSVEGDKSISLDGKTGVITGLTNTTLDVAGFGQSTRAATEEQLKALSDKAKTTVSVNNEGKDENKNLALTEKTEQDGHTNYDIKLADKVTLGKDNNKVVVNGENGSIVVGGNAEKAVTINGTEGTVTNLSNRTWEIGKTEAVKGRAATEDQLKALDTVINGGLNFATQTANVVINRKLGDTLEIVGGNAEAEVKAEDYTGANIRTFSENNKVVIRMAKNVNLTDKGSVNVGNTVVNNDGVEIKRPAGDKAEATVVTLTGNGLNNGGNTITNVKAGEKDTDVVNVSQLNAKAAAAKTTVSVNGEDKDANKNLVLTESKATDGHTNYDVKLANKVTLGTDTTKQVILDGTAGSITAGSGNNVVIVDGSKALIRVGNGTNRVSIDGASGHITGLANREWVVGETTAVSGRAATEDQLKSVSDKVNVVASNTIKLSGDKGSVTDVQRLDQKNGINFSVVGDNKYIETKAEGSKVAVGLTEDIKGKIDNAANNNLTNITNEGKKEITKLGTIVEGSDSVSVSVSKEDKDTGQKTYKVDLKPVVAIGDSNKVTINGTTGNVGGLTNKTWNPDQITSGQAATEDQLKVVHNEVKDVMNKGLTFKAQDNSSVTKKLGDTLDVVGENGITTVVSTDNKLVVKLGNNLNIGEKAKNGKEGVDGSIGVNGKDGSAVVINGKDGSIGLNGKDGKNGITIKGADGKVGVDGKDGTTRIVYTENNKTHEVATTEDGMKFGGDKGTTVSRKLNSQLNVKGGAKGELTENNIAVVADGNDTLNVKLAKDVDLGDKGSVKIGKTVINENGVTIGLDKKTAVKLTEEGLNNGGRRVTNIAEGKENTDAVSVSQLRRTNQAVINNAHNIARLDNKIDNVDRNLRAGIAGALATGGLYQAAQPGKSMISAGAGTYKGQNAVAVGYSRISDNGKIGVKFSVNSNTRGDKGAAASVGYQW